MIKKIQQYLLLHYPTLWNIKIIPMFLIMTGLHITFFIIGYASAKTTFDKSYYYYSPSNDLGILYFVTVLVGILLLIGWLVFYSRNNGFKTFYPRKTHQLYLEWIMILIITIGISFMPFTLTQGYITKWKSVATVSEAEKAIDILDKVNILIPNDRDSYRYNQSYNKPIPIPNNMHLNIDTLDLNLFETTYSYKDGITIKGYTGPSLIFYDNYRYEYYNQNKQSLSTSERKQIETELTVKRWLQNGNKDSIYMLMQDFEKLQQKHKLTVNLTPKKWLKRIYNPPFFPVENTTIIYNYNAKENDSYYTDYATQVEVVSSIEETTESDVAEATAVAVPEEYTYIEPETLPYLQYNELKAGYDHILNYYNYAEETEYISLFCLCVAICLSIFIYSFRATNGKSWLIAFVTSGVLIFIVSLLAVALNSIRWNDDIIILIFISMFWLSLFITFISRIAYKVQNKQGKGRSTIYMNILLWLTPCIVPLLFFCYIAFVELSNDYSYRMKGEEIINMFWVNIPIVTLAMYPICILVRKWKSIAEE